MSPRTSSFLHVVSLSCAAIIFVCLLYSRLTWVFSHNLPISTDGFYYLLEIREYMSVGEGYFSESSVFFWSLGFLASLFQLSPERVFQFLVVFSVLVFPATVLLIARTRKQLLIGFLVGSLYFVSDVVFFRHYAFPRQALSLSFVMSAILVFEHIFQQSPTFGRKLLAWSFLILGACLHLSGAVAAWLWMIFAGERLRLTRDTRIFVAIVGCVGGLIFLINTDKNIFAQESAELSKGLYGLCKRMECSSFEWLETLLYLCFPLFFTLYGAIRGLISNPYTSAIVGIFLFQLPIWTTVGDMAYRLNIVSVWFVILLLLLSVKIKRSFANFPISDSVVWRHSFRKTNISVCFSVN